MKKIKNLNIEKIIHHFLYSALWTEELDTKHNVEDFAPSAFTKAREIINFFLEKAPKESLEKYLEYHKQDPEGQLGHDIWLSINGHGAGFFDHPLLGHEDILQQVCQDMRDVDKTAYINQVWVSEVGNIFIE